MLKNEYLNWSMSSNFELAKLRKILSQILPFSTSGKYSEQYNLKNMEIRLCYHILDTIKRNHLLGVDGDPTIRMDMPAEELVFKILVNDKVSLIKSDYPYYLTPAENSEPMRETIEALLQRQFPINLTWTYNEPEQQVECIITTPINSQILNRIPVEINQYGNTQIKIIKDKE